VANKIVVYAFQAADLLHFGHLNALRQAKKLGDYLICGVLTDEAIMVYKREPVIPFRERFALVKHCDYVDLAVRQDSVDPTENIKIYKPDILVHGDDWSGDFPGAEYMRNVGGKVVLTKYYEKQSTTKIIEKIMKMVVKDIVELCDQYTGWMPKGGAK